MRRSGIPQMGLDAGGTDVRARVVAQCGGLGEASGQLGASASLEIGHIAGMISLHLRQAVRAEFLAERLRNDESHHRLAHHARGRDRRDV
jgi:hypothetical protein